MHREKAGYVVICDEHLKVVGIFTERNVLMQVLKEGVSLKDPVSKYMRPNPFTLKKTDTVGDAIKAMHEHNMRHIPLVDDLGQLVGVLSARTVITFLAELFPTEVFNLPPRAKQTFGTAEGG
jgi:CBS domain-containing protein